MSTWTTITTNTTNPFYYIDCFGCGETYGVNTSHICSHNRRIGELESQVSSLRRVLSSLLEYLEEQKYGPEYPCSPKNLREITKNAKAILTENDK